MWQDWQQPAHPREQLAVAAMKTTGQHNTYEMKLEG
jgi:hypothetical protein